MVKLLLRKEAQGYWVTMKKAKEDSHSTVIHTMEWRKRMPASTRTVEIPVSVCNDM